MKYLPLSFALVLLAGCESTPKAPVPAATDSGAASASVSYSDPFLKANASKPGVHTLPSGLQYQVLASGPAGGRSPSYYDQVKVHYHGMLTNGSVFDSSIERGTPAVFGVGQVIPGWTQALQMMKPGDKWMLYIPSSLAYGRRSMGDKIPADSTLVFRVELLGIGGGA